MDVTAGDLDGASRGEQATGDGAADAGGAIDCSRAGSGGSFDSIGDDGLTPALPRDKPLPQHPPQPLARLRRL